MNLNAKRFLSILLSVLFMLDMLTGIGLAEEKTKDLFAMNTLHHGFRVYQVESVDYIGVDLYFMEHEKTGARLIYAACADQERAFGVSFRTQSLNDKGLPHVFEHSALSGCEKYPDSNLFFSMLNQTYNSYMNAETQQFATIYPIASFSEDQLFADMDLYMNGVLYPILLRDERAMMREAWHYNLDDPEGEITISGIVYSEMAANFNNMQYVAGEKLKKLLFPGSYSSNNAGGDPSVIPDMTYQELLDFHAKYYHPSNMLMMLYGDFADIGRFLEHLDSEYLSKYDRVEISFDDPDYQPVRGYQELTCKIPATQNAETDHAALIDYAFVLDNLSTLDYTLTSIAALSLSTETSLIQQRISSRFPLSVFEVLLDNNAAQPVLHFKLSGANPDDASAFKAAVDEMLPVIMQEPVDDSIINRIINITRYSRATVRENINAGVSFFTSFAESWSKTGKPDAFLEELRITDDLMKYQKDGSIRAVLGKVLPEASASAMIIAVPEAGMVEKNAADLAARLADMKAGMTAEEVQALVDKCAEYNAWVENNAKVSLIDQMKAVDAGSLPEEYPVASVNDETVDGIRRITSVIPNCETFDMAIRLDAQGLPFERLLDATLAAALMGESKTENYSKDALAIEKYNKLNGLLCFIENVHDETGPAHQYLCITGNGLCDQLDDTFSLMEEFVFRTDFSDYDSIRAIAAEKAATAGIFASAIPDTCLTAIGQALVDPGYFIDYYLEYSPEYRSYLENIVGMSDDELEEVSERLRDTVVMMLNSPGAIVTAYGSEESVRRCLEKSDDFLGRLGHETREPVDYSAYSTLKGNTAFVIDTSVAYNYRFLSMKAADLEASGQRLVTKSIVTDMILLPELRFRYNAYSASNSVSSSFAYLKTYRDPNITKTYEVFDTIPDKLRGLDLSEAQLDGYITSSYSSVVGHHGPAAMAAEAIDNALMHKDPGNKLRCIREIKATDADDVRAAADLYEKICTDGVIVAGISEEMLAENPNLFETVLR